MASVEVGAQEILNIPRHDRTKLMTHQGARTRGNNRPIKFDEIRQQESSNMLSAVESFLNTTKTGVSNLQGMRKSAQSKFFDKRNRHSRGKSTNYQSSANRPSTSEVTGFSAFVNEPGHKGRRTNKDLKERDASFDSIEF